MDPDVYRLLLWAREAWSSRTGEGLARALELRDQAIARNPAYTEAYAARAEGCVLLVTYGMRRLGGP